jgi:hypothetical protein
LDFHLINPLGSTRCDFWFIQNMHVGVWESGVWQVVI